MVKAARWIFLLLLLLAFTVAGYLVWPRSPIKHKPGKQVASVEPQQMPFEGDTIFRHGRYRIEPLADFKLDALVLSVAYYSWDREAELAPVDLALGWGPMSDEAVLDKISISQRNRRYYWQTPELPVPREEVVTNSANMHLIPANKRVGEKLNSVRRGHVIKVDGYLVEVSAPDGWNWKSSLTRSDSGSGACELIYVGSLSLSQD